MNSPHHSGEINFYDELGVERNASFEEIREAYRALVRMLHPDQHTDEHLRVIAERQLRKLNSVYAVLANPEQRRIYDEDLADGYAQPIIVNAPASEGAYHFLVTRIPFARHIVWAAAILLGVGLLAWLAWDNTSTPTPRGRETVVAAAPDSAAPVKKTGSKTDAATIQRLQADLRIVAAQRDAAQHNLDALRASIASKSERRTYEPPPVPSPEHAETLLTTPMPTPPALPAGALAGNAKLALSSLAPPAPRPESEKHDRKLAGFWFYVKPQNQAGKNRGDYAPEFIEATITEANGVLHGNYRSRFRIVDRPISPDVNFTFAGSPSGAVLKCPWSGPGGAKGELTVQLVSENSIRLEWTAVDLGTQQGLVSGTAVLTRKVD